MAEGPYPGGADSLRLGYAEPRAALPDLPLAGSDSCTGARVPGPNGAMQAPHLLVAIHMRGILSHLFTRVYFSDEASNAEDPILKLVPGDRRDTLIAKRDGSSSTYRIQFQIQGDGETVFFDI